VFLNAQNWQTTAVLADPLRRAGIPAAITLDLDTAIEDATWPRLIALTGASGSEVQRLQQVHLDLRNALKSAGRVASADTPWQAKIGGLNALDNAARPIAQSAIDEFEARGIFLVPVGELERWLPQFGKTNKQTWVTDMLQLLGSPGDATYVAPGPGDVWNFVERVAHWIGDPERGGLPA
jgi:hypothetical protein